MVTLTKEEIIQNHQFNINRAYVHQKKITEVLKTDQFLGQRCFIIGGGESLTGFNFSLLKGEKVIVVNKSFLSYPDADIVYFMDVTFYESLRQKEYDKFEQDNIYEKWKKLRAVKICLSPLNNYNFLDNDVYCIRRLYAPELVLDLNYGMYGGSNSGLGAINLAVLLGFGPIYLLGYDMQVKNKTHYHKGYPESEVNGMRKRVEGYKKDIERFSVKYKEFPRQIYNVVVNQDSSSLDCFIKVPLANIFKSS